MEELECIFSVSAFYVVLARVLLLALAGLLADVDGRGSFLPFWHGIKVMMITKALV